MPYQAPAQRDQLSGRTGRRGNATPAVAKFRARMGRMLHNPIMLRRFVAGALPRVGNLQHENAAEAVRLVLRGRPLACVARELGLPVATVAYWYERFEQHVTTVGARAREERERRSGAGEQGGSGGGGAGQENDQAGGGFAGE